MQSLKPLCVVDVGLPTGRVLGITRIDQDDLQAAFFQNFVNGHPVDARRLHRNRRDTDVLEPIREAVQVPGEAAELANRLGIGVCRNSTT